MFEVGAYLGKTIAEIRAMPLWEYHGWQAHVSAKRKAQR